MKRVRGLQVVVAASLALLAGCSMAPGSTTNAAQIAARDLAMSVTDPTSGTTQEVADLGFAFYGAWGLGPRPWSMYSAGGFELYLAEGLVSGQLAWNASKSDYEASFSRSVSAGAFSGSSTVSLALTFLTSTDGTGTGVQVAPLTTGATALAGIHSIAYSRQLQADVSNAVTHAQRTTSSSSSFLLSNLVIGGSTPGFSLSGSKFVQFTHVNADGVKVVGTLSQNIPTSSPVVVSAVLQPDGSYLVAATGQIQVIYDATITQADGTTSTVSHTATVTLNGQRTVHVEMDGTDVDADSTTGETE